MLPSQYVIANWQDELPQSTVNAIVQTEDGYLWLGTQGGLARFDGLDFTVFDRSNTPQLQSQDVRALLEASDGTLWVGTRGGDLLTFGSNSLRPVSGEGWPAVQAVQTLAEDDHGAIWIGTRGSGLVRFKTGRFETFAEARGLPVTTILALLAAPDGVVWIGTRNQGLYRWDGAQFNAVGGRQLAEESILSLAMDETGTLWIGTRQSGILRWPKPPQGEPVAIAGTASVPVMSLRFDLDENLWAGSYGDGLIRLRENRPSWLRVDDGLSSPNVMAVFEDREGNLWAGTEGGGLDRLRAGAFRTFGKPEGLNSDQVWTVLEDSTATVWVGTDDGGLGRLRQGEIQTLTTANGLGSNSVSALLEDGDGRLWIGARGAGIDILNGRRVSHLGRGQGLTSDTVFSMHHARDGTIWVATRSQGLLRWRQGRFGPLPESSALPADVRIWAFADGPHGELLVGTDGHGLAVLRDGEVVNTITTADGLSSDTVSAIHVGDNGDLWLGTYGAGLNLVRGDQVHTFSTPQGLFDDVILRILPDRSGNLWMSCNRGIFRVAIADLEAVAAGTARRVTSTVFGEAQGMRSAECNGFLQPAGFAGRDGRLWFPTIAGVVVVDPQAVTANPVPPGVVVESVRMDGRELAFSDTVELPAGSGRLDVRYAGLSFVEPTKVTFRYRLEGYDPEWVEAGSERRATYTNLPTGRSYHFEVLAANEDGLWNEQPASFTLVIAPRLWQRPLFQLAALLALGLLAWGLYSLRVRQLIRRTQRLEELVDERTAEVVEQRDQLEVANTELVRLNQFKTEFLGIAAHDLKNPLTVIHGDASRIASGKTDAERSAKAASRISGSARQMLNIVSDLLDTTAIESGKLSLDRQPTDLKKLVEGMVERNRVAAAERDLKLDLRLPFTALEANVDAEKIARIADNLLSNAVHYSKRGGRIEVRLQASDGETPRIITLAVTDQGPGLSLEQLARLFQRFGRLDTSHGHATASTGLGLYIVKQFVELHGGEVKVKSEPGQGSTFSVEFPG